MKKSLKRVASVFLSVCMLIGMAACKEKTEISNKEKTEIENSATGSEQSESSLPVNSEENPQNGLRLKVYFNAGNGESMPSLTREVGKTYGELPTPTWEKQEFLGWYTERMGGTPITANTKVVKTKDHILYARWAIAPVDVFIPNNLAKPNEEPLVQYPLQPAKKRIMAAHDNSYIIDKDGKLYGWGVNEYGQLGNGTTEDLATPVQIMPEKRFTYVDSRDSNTYAIDTEGNLWGWGKNKVIPLGDGDGTKEVRTTPVQIMPGTKFYKVVISSHPYAIDVNGNLWAWGQRIFGDNPSVAVPAELSPIQIQEGVRFFDVASKSQHTVALDEYGRLWTWGSFDNAYGELGTGPIVDIITQAYTQCYKRTILIESSIRFTQVAVGINNSAALDVNGNIWVWGENDKGDIGDGTKDNKLSPTQITSGGKFHFLYGDGTTYYTIDKNYNIWAWGIMTIPFMSLGVEHGVRHLIPTEIIKGSNICDVSFGYYQAIALDVNGDVWGWGLNAKGLLGNDKEDKAHLAPFKMGY